MTRGRKFFQGLDRQTDYQRAILFMADSVPHGDYRHNDSQHRHGIQNYSHQIHLPGAGLPDPRKQLSSACCIGLVGICQIVDRRGSSATDIYSCSWKQVGEDRRGRRLDCNTYKALRGAPHWQPPISQGTGSQSKAGRRCATHHRPTPCAGAGVLRAGGPARCTKKIRAAIAAFPDANELFARNRLLTATLPQWSLLQCHSDEHKSPIYQNRYCDGQENNLGPVPS